MGSDFINTLYNMVGSDTIRSDPRDRLGVNKSTSLSPKSSAPATMEGEIKGQKPKVVEKMKLINSIKINPIDIIGSFGSGQSGQVEGSLRLNGSGVLQPYMSYGVWGQAWLVQISDNSFRADFDSDIVQVLATGTVPRDFELFIEFKDVNTLRFVSGGEQMGTDFVRNVTLDQLPVVPYLLESCGSVNYPLQSIPLKINDTFV
ncbi:hypothetical protein Fcan01_26788 [Folsomia candida]|uniref:Uncharacterized protein n=1 Tax=Folsomia candida TaxID=158441 RepID=A0A226CZN4_FOLCA|nr:hypothetical protein Fcan01_26788 [Folsomia candida]